MLCYTQSQILSSLLNSRGGGGGGGGDVNQWMDRDVPILLSIWYPKI